MKENHYDIPSFMAEVKRKDACFKLIQNFGHTNFLFVSERVFHLFL